MSLISLSPIGTIRTPFTDIANMPIQPRGAIGVRGTIEILPEFVPGLADLAEFSHIFVIYHLHQAPPAQLRVVPFLDSREHGIFSTRSPARPNPVGISVWRLRGIRGASLDVENVDVLDLTPLIDIKPFVPDFDCWDVESIGWLSTSSRAAGNTRSDGRFRNDRG